MSPFLGNRVNLKVVTSCWTFINDADFNLISFVCDQNDFFLELFCIRRLLKHLHVLAWSLQISLLVLISQRAMSGQVWHCQNALKFFFTYCKTISTWFDIRYKVIPEEKSTSYWRWSKSLWASNIYYWKNIVFLWWRQFNSMFWIWRWYSF